MMRTLVADGGWLDHGYDGANGGADGSYWFIMVDVCLMMVVRG